MELWHIIEFDSMEVGTFWTSNFILKEWKNIFFCYYLNFYYLINGWIIILDIWELITGYSG